MKGNFIYLRWQTRLYCLIAFGQIRLINNGTKTTSKKNKPGEKAVFAANPYYDDVLAFAELVVPTSQDKYKLIDKERELHPRVSKSNVKDFKEKIQERTTAEEKNLVAT